MDIIPENSRIEDELYQEITARLPIFCVDLVVIRKGKDGAREFLLIKRKIPPEAGKWCLVGGRVLGGLEAKPETLLEAIERQGEIELGVKLKIVPPWDSNHPVVLFDQPKADPSKYPIIAVYPVEVIKGSPRPGPESSEVEWFDYKSLPGEMGFTHREELEAVKEGLERKHL